MGTKKGGLTAYIEKRFYQYEKIKKAVWEARHDAGANKTGGNGSGHAFVSDPTANAAMMKSMPLYAVNIEVGKNEVETVKQPEKWLTVVEQTYKYFAEEDTDIGSLLKMKYAGEMLVKICMDLHISEQSYYYKLDKGREQQMRCALQEQLVKIY